MTIFKTILALLLLAAFFITLPTILRVVAGG